MKKKPSFIIFILLVIGIFGVLIADYVKEKNFAIPIQSKSTDMQGVGMNSQTNVITLPVALNSQNVANVYLAYSFFGPLKEVKKGDKGFEIVLDTNEKSLPQFFATEADTKVYRTNKTNPSELTPARIEDLKTGSQVSISATYDIKISIWVTRAVYISD